MLSPKDFVHLASAFPEVTISPHFEAESFRYKKKIFATCFAEKNLGMVKLDLTNQSVFCAFKDNAFYPVPNTWGKKGYTFIDLTKVRTDMCRDALSVAYELITRRGKK